MDRLITRVLEIGLGCLIFAMGLSFFITMNSRTLAYTSQGTEMWSKQHQVLVSEGEEAAHAYTREAIYMLLTDDSMQPDRSAVGDVSDGSSAIKVYIDGISYPAVSDYQGRRSLKISLEGLKADLYDIRYVTDGSYRITEIHFTGR